jgi:hypothetical protein
MTSAGDAAEDQANLIYSACSVSFIAGNGHLSSDHLVECVDQMSGSLKAEKRCDGVTNQLRAAK